jgi:hypothetical protein
LRGRLKDVTVRQALMLALNEAGADPGTRLVVKDNLVQIREPLGLLTLVYPVQSLMAQLRQTNPVATDDENIASVINSITKNIDPDSWRDNGGTVGAISQLSKQLIVTQTPENHERVKTLLADLEKSHAR